MSASEKRCNHPDGVKHNGWCAACASAPVAGAGSGEQVPAPDPVDFDKAERFARYTAPKVTSSAIHNLARAYLALRASPAAAPREPSEALIVATEGEVGALALRLCEALYHSGEESHGPDGECCAECARDVMRIATFAATAVSSHPPAPAGTPPTDDAEYGAAVKALCELIPGFHSPQSSEWPRQLEVVKRFERAIARASSPAGTPREPGWTEASGKAWSLIRDGMLRAIRLSEEQAPREEESAKLDAFAAQCAKRVLEAVGSAVPDAGEVSEAAIENVARNYVVQHEHGIAVLADKMALIRAGIALAASRQAGK